MRQRRRRKPCFNGQSTEACCIFRPSGWEILNTVAVVVKRQRVSAERGREFLEQLATLNFRIDAPPHTGDFPRLHGLATLHQLTAYDVAYLDLAKRLSLPLATRDKDLRKAALAEGLQTL